MNSHLMIFARARAWIGAGLFAFTIAAQAFPPAPDHVVFGMVRTELGDPVDVTNATIALETMSGTRISTTLVPTLAPGVNYRLYVPMDAGLTSDAYIPTALRPTVPFRIKVVIGNTVYLPIQMQADYSHLGKPAQQTRLDLTLGVDSSGDGLPDAWKRMILAMSKGLYTNISQILPGGHFPGNPMTFREAYIAGTYPWDLKQGFALSVIGTHDDTPVMEFQSIQGRSYGILGSADLKEWNQLPFRIVETGATNSLIMNYQATDIRTLRIEVPPVPGAPTNRFFQATVQ